MDQSARNQYQILFERMLRCMADFEHFDREEFVRVLRELAALFRLSKGVTEFYQTVRAEKDGEGEVMIDYDTGKKDHPVLRHRILSRSKSVIISTLYMADDENPLEEEEREKLDLILRVLVHFIARNRFEDSVEKLGYYDDDGYPNTRFYLRFLDSLIEQGSLPAYTAACFNLRSFSAVNQEFGRKTGDLVFRNYFDALQAAAGDDGVVCRMGGDNFVMAFKKALTEKVLGLLSGTPVICDPKSGQRLLVSASAGILNIPAEEPAPEPGDIMGRAFAAMLAAKQNKETPVVYYDKEMISERKKTVQIHLLFPKALENNEFKVFYQPKVDIDTGKIVGAEALCRWFRDGHMVPPGEFIPVLERTSEICRLDFHMLELVCRDIRRWLDEGRQLVRVSVNLSRKHLSDVDLREHILEIVDRYQVPHESIEIELTETATEVGFQSLKRVAEELQKSGFCISVDDFGMGYSSLNLIREIPWNVLKIDRCFLPTDDEPEGSTTSLMYGHVIAMARDIGLECISEGVETPKQVEILRKNQCRLAQGFLYDKPLAVEDFELRLSQGYYRKGS
ncbi:MAG: bifunctional diguanylate cyclase/phosphodiesterase [Lachnospiraceae bacterium]|nr:bifunctional diguanylate cyclase/phosphodiesterase [Lachnospiraceae bacterium]